MLIINGCVSFGTDLFNHSKGLFFNGALDLSASTICPFMFKSGRTFQMVGWTYQVKRRQIKKEGKKRWGENRKKRKRKKGRKKEKKKEKKEKSQDKRKEREKEGGKKIE